MNRRHVSPLFVAVIVVTTFVLAHGQQSPPIGSTAVAASTPTQIPATKAPAAVPPFLPVSGALVDQSGKAVAGPVEITLAVYLEREGGTPLWSEVQTVQADQRGQYSVTLGAASSSGIPVSVFASGGVRWLEVSPSGENELARTPILSVPYALKAGDAETLGGKPASAFLTSTGNPGEAAASSGSTASRSAPAPMAPSPSAPTFTATANPGPGFISLATSGPPLQVSSSAAVTNLNADLVDGFHAAAFPKLATANTFAASQTIDTGNLDLDPSTATTGNITKNGARFLHNFGTQNTFLGINAGNLTLTGNANTGIGQAALTSTTSGGGNTASGFGALQNNITGGINTATGLAALQLNTAGTLNTAFGAQALQNNMTSSENTAVGHAALFNNNSAGGSNTAIGNSALASNAAGSNSVALGYFAGFNATGSNNIYLGANVQGIAGESNAMYLGGTQTKTVIAGVRGTTVTGGEAVIIDANGRLGSGTVAPAANSVGSNEVIDNSLTASDLAPDSVTTSELAPSSVTADKVAFNYAGSSSAGGPATDLACVGCVAANEVSFSFASLGANTFTATQTIDTGNVDLDPSTATTGNITKNGTPFLHNFGSDNTFVGVNAGNVNMTGGENTASGAFALFSNTAGIENTASGASALRANTTGISNTAIAARGTSRRR